MFLMLVTCTSVDRFLGLIDKLVNVIFKRLFIGTVP